MNALFPLNPSLAAELNRLFVRSESILMNALDATADSDVDDFDRNGTSQEYCPPSRLRLQTRIRPACSAPNARMMRKFSINSNVSTSSPTSSRASGPANGQMPITSAMGSDFQAAEKGNRPVPSAPPSSPNAPRMMRKFSANSDISNSTSSPTTSSQGKSHVQNASTSMGNDDVFPSETGNKPVPPPPNAPRMIRKLTTNSDVSPPSLAQTSSQEKSNVQVDANSTGTGAVESNVNNGLEPSGEIWKGKPTAKKSFEKRKSCSFCKNNEHRTRGAPTDTNVYPCSPRFDADWRARRAWALLRLPRLLLKAMTRSWRQYNTVCDRISLSFRLPKLRLTNVRITCCRNL